MNTSEVDIQIKTKISKALEISIFVSFDYLINIFSIHVSHGFLH